MSTLLTIPHLPNHFQSVQPLSLSPIPSHTHAHAPTCTLIRPQPTHFHIPTHHSPTHTLHHLPTHSPTCQPTPSSVNTQSLSPKHSFKCQSIPPHARPLPYFDTLPNQPTSPPPTCSPTYPPAHSLPYPCILHQHTNFPTRTPIFLAHSPTCSPTFSPAHQLPHLPTHFLPAH